MAFLCQRPDDNSMFPHSLPSSATTVFLFVAAARTGGGDLGLLCFLGRNLLFFRADGFGGVIRLD